MIHDSNKLEKDENTEIGLKFVGKDLSPFLKIGVILTILILSEKIICCKEILNKCFIVENISLVTVLMMSDLAF